MKHDELTFEAIDNHITNANLSRFEPDGTLHFNAAARAADPGGVVSKICAIYKVVRPILVVVSDLPLIPPTWKKALKTFVALMDTLCP